MIRVLRTSWFMFRLYVRQSLYHKAGAVGTVVTWALRIGLTIFLYQKIYHLMGKAEIHGLSFPVALSGMVYFAVFFAFGTRQVSREINRDFKSGSIGTWYNKPISYAGLKIAQVLGKNMMGAIFILTVFVTIAAHIVMQDNIDHIGWRFGVMALSLLMGLLISLCFFTMIGLSAIFLGATDAIENIVSKFIMILGGAYVPVGFFPEKLRLIGDILPTTAMTYGGQFLYSDFIDHAPRFLMLQVMWIVTLGFLVCILNRKVAKHLSVNGG